MAFDQERHDQLDALRRGGLTAEQVRRWAAETGRIGQMSPQSDEKWPVTFVILWIALRNKTDVENAWLGALEAGTLPFNQEINGKSLYFDAKNELWHAAAAGKFEAYVDFIDGWVGNFIPARVWTADFNFSRNDRISTFEYFDEKNILSYVNVTIPRVQVMSCWPSRIDLKSRNTLSKQRPFIEKRAYRVGRPPDVTSRVDAEMRDALVKGEDIGILKGKQLKERFRASRTLCSEVRKSILSEQEAAN